MQTPREMGQPRRSTARRAALWPGALLGTDPQIQPHRGAGCHGQDPTPVSMVEHHSAIQETEIQRLPRRGHSQMTRAREGQRTTLSHPRAEFKKENRGKYRKGGRRGLRETRHTRFLTEENKLEETEGGGWWRGQEGDGGGRARAAMSAGVVCEGGH